VQQWAVVGFSGVLALICLYWIYDYLRRRTGGR